jgi:hypothetical protein
MATSLGTALPVASPGYYPQADDDEVYEDDLKPYASLFLKPFTNRKCAFSKHELGVMCQDPLHSPRLILYLINFFKQM